MSRALPVNFRKQIFGRLVTWVLGSNSFLPPTSSFLSNSLGQSCKYYQYFELRPKLSTKGPKRNLVLEIIEFFTFPSSSRHQHSVQEAQKEASRSLLVPVTVQSGRVDVRHRCLHRGVHVALSHGPYFPVRMDQPLSLHRRARGAREPVQCEQFVLVHDWIANAAGIGDSTHCRVNANGCR